MAGLLVSVRDAAEAADAIAAGADLIDVKEPAAGSLGAAAPRVIAEVLRVVNVRRPVSVALGELAGMSLDWDSLVSQLPDGPMPQFAKFGLAGCGDVADWAERWGLELAKYPPGVAAVAVVYADWQAARAPAPEFVLAEGARLGCRAMLVDTHDKRGPDLLGHWSIDELAQNMATARRLGMLIVLGGKITAAHLDQLLPLAPDYIAVRGAVCRGERSGRLDPALVRRLADQLSALPTAPSPAGVGR